MFTTNISHFLAGLFFLLVLVTGWLLHLPPAVPWYAAPIVALVLALVVRIAMAVLNPMVRAVPWVGVAIMMFLAILFIWPIIANVTSSNLTTYVVSLFSVLGGVLMWPAVFIAGRHIKL